MASNVNYLQPTIPQNWHGSQKRFAQQVIDTLDIVFLKLKTINELKKILLNLKEQMQNGNQEDAIALLNDAIAKTEEGGAV